MCTLAFTSKDSSLIDIIIMKVIIFNNPKKSMSQKISVFFKEEDNIYRYKRNLNAKKLEIVIF